jgi:hypothetical protein
MPWRVRSAARFDAVLTTASLDEAGKSAWCREHGVYPQTLAACKLELHPQKTKIVSWSHATKRTSRPQPFVGGAGKMGISRFPCWSAQALLLGFGLDRDEAHAG